MSDLSAMKTARTTVTLLGLVLLSSSLALPACGGEPDTPAPTESEESNLVSQIRLDRVTPAEVAATYAKDLEPQIAACIAGHPDITAVDEQSLPTFYRTGPGGRDYHWDLSYAIKGMLRENGGQAIPVGELAARIEPYAVTVLSRHVDGDGFYVPPRDGMIDFYGAELRTREDKAFSLAKDPAGMTLRDVREQWRAVERDQGNLDSAWLNPVKLGGEPRLGDIRKAMGIARHIAYVTWGNDAVAQFHAAGEGPDNAREFLPIKALLEQRSIKKRWFFAGGGESYSRHYLVVLDEHDQLWGFMMGYSE